MSKLDQGKMPKLNYLFIILPLIVVPTSSVVVTLTLSAALFSWSRLSGSAGRLAHCLAASTMSAVASANALAADNRRF